jgi:uncharacterized protein (TIGR03437 family)
MLWRLAPLALALAALCLGDDSDCKPNGPCYAGQGIVNIASGVSGALAPNTLASIYGTDLSYLEKSLSSEYVSGSNLPIVLPGTGVHVLVGGYPANIFYVSPTQVNFLVPSNLRAVQVDVQVVRNGTNGPLVPVMLQQAAPALFMKDAKFAIVSHVDFDLVTSTDPLRPGDWAVLWATGLGATDPPADYGAIPHQGAWLVNKDSFQVLLNGVVVPAARVGYAGLAPECAGLYQINVLLPMNVSADPEVRILAGTAISPAGVHLHLKP